MRWVMSVLVMCVALLFTANAVCAEVYNMVVGQEKSITSTSVSKVAVGDPGVANAQDTGEGRILVTAVGPGSTDILLWDEAGNESSVKVNVARRDPKPVAEAITKLVQGVEGVTVVIADDMVVIDGQVITDSDMQRVSKIAESFGGVLNLVKPNAKRAADVLAEDLQKQIGLPNVQVTIRDDTVTLTGTVYDESTKEMIGKIAQPYVANVVNLLEVDDSMVEIDVQFLNINTTKASQYGFNLPQHLTFGFDMSMGGKDLPGGTTKYEYQRQDIYKADREAVNHNWGDLFEKSGRTITNTLTSGFSIGLDKQLYLNWLLSNGMAKVVAKPHLTTFNGQEATIGAGGTVYIKIEGGEGSPASLESVEWGTKLKIKPILLDKERVQCTVGLEVSTEADPNNQQYEVNYSLDKYTSDGTITCKLGETVMIAGLLQEFANRAKEETPLLGKIPPINLFFSESSKKKHNRDLLILVTPYAPTLQNIGEAASGTTFPDRKISTEKAR